MYYQDDNNCNNECYPCENKMYCECKIKPRKNRKCCIDLIIFIFSILLALTVGLIIGSIPIVSLILFFALSALIALAVVFAIGIIVRIIELNCKNRNY